MIIGGSFLRATSTNGLRFTIDTKVNQVTSTSTSLANTLEKTTGVSKVTQVTSTSTT